jgi:hypothetical protein
MTHEPDIAASVLDCVTIAADDPTWPVTKNATIPQIQSLKAPLNPLSLFVVLLIFGLNGGCSEEVGPTPSRASQPDHRLATFDFRGYNEYSDCSEIVSAEERIGSQINGVEVTDGPVSPDIHITAMTVEVFGVAMEAEIRCRLNGDLLHAVYWVNGDDEEASRSKFQTISAGLSEKFGEPKEVEHEGGISHTFVCNDLAEIYLADVFRPMPGDPYSVFMTVDLLRRECMLP